MGIWLLWQQAPATIKIMTQSFFQISRAKKSLHKRSRREECGIPGNTLLLQKLQTTKCPAAKGQTMNVIFTGHLIHSGEKHSNGYLSLSAHCEPNTTVVSTSLIHATNSPHSIAIIISLKIPTTPIHQ